jgi:hypothetical protein
MTNNDGIRVPPADEAGDIVRARFQEFLQTFIIPNDSNELTEQRYI